MRYDDDGVPERMIGVFQDITERKEAEDILAKSEQLFRQMTENVHEVFWMMPTTIDRFLYISAAYEEVWGRSCESLYNNPHERLEAIHPDDREKIAAAIKHLARGKFHEEYRIVRPDGAIRYIDDKAFPVLDTYGNIYRVAGFAHDITIRKEAEKERERSNKLLDALSKAQSSFISDTNPVNLFDELLAALLKLTESEYGFIGQVLHKKDGTAYLKNFATTDVSWNEPTRKFYKENAPEGLEFFNLKSIFGAVITTGEPVIANDPANDPRRCGIPEGHPTLNSFLGLPFHSGDKLVGMIAIANRPGGYDEEVIEFLQPFLSTCNNIINAYQNDQRKRIFEEELSKSEKYLARAQEIANIGHWTLDPKTSNIEGSDELFRIFGLTREEATLEAFLGAVHPDDREMDANVINRGIEHGEDWDIEHRLVMKDGTEKIIHTIGNAVTDISGKTELLVGTVQDVTEHKRAEEALSESRELLNSILDNSTTVVYAKDLEGRYLLINTIYEKLFKVKREDIIGMTDHDIFPVEMADAFHANDLKVITSEKSIEFEEIAPHDDGPHTYISVKFPLHDKNGKTYAVCGISTDITARVRADEELEKSRESLESAQKVARIGNWDWDITENTLYWSDEIFRIFKIEEDDFEASYDCRR